MGTLSRIVPAPLRPILRRALRRAQHLTTRRGTRDDLQQYWRTASEAGNRPDDYLDGAERSGFLVRLVAALPERPMRVFEVGCNVGRNLQYLREAGYRALEGVEINADAVALMKTTYPEMARESRIHVGPVEEILPALPDHSYDLVFSMAVLEHIHKDSEWVFEYIGRLSARHIITIEDEECVSSRHFPRNYRRVFERYGFRQTSEEDASAVRGLGPGFVARVFARA